MANTATESELREKLRQECQQEGGQTAWAVKHGLSPQFVHDVLTERRYVTERMAEELGFRREIVFYETEKD